MIRSRLLPLRRNQATFPIYPVSGFTLIELAIVLFILSLMLGALLPPFAARIEQEERKQTDGQLDEIEEIIYGYALKNYYLPCPDCRDNTGNCAAVTANDGAEDTIAGAGTSLVCASEAGNLPWTTLGIKGTDAWGEIFTYRVTDTFADRNDNTNTDGTGCTPETLNVSFALCSDGDITILDSDGGSNIATNVPAVVVSHGSNGEATPTSLHELENYDDGTAGDTDGTFVDKDFSRDATEEFDDMLIWISPHALRSKMVQAGILP